MKFLTLLVLVFSLPLAEAQAGLLQRVASHSMVQKALRGGMIVLVPLCLGPLSSCVAPSQLNSTAPAEAEKQPLASQPTEETTTPSLEESNLPPFELAPAEDFQPAQTDDPYTIKVYHPNGFGGIREDDINDYMRAKDGLPARFYKDMIIHYSNGDDNFIGIAQLNGNNENALNVIDMEHEEVNATISTKIIDGIFITVHDDYGGGYVKFSAMHLQKLMGKKVTKFGWSNLIAETRIVFSSGYHLVWVHGMQVSQDKFIRFSNEQKFWGLVPSNYVSKLGN